jgi:phospho-N-acetylmuramoyl-pentapeptide-transferase
MRETSLALTLSGLSFMMTVIWGGPLIRILRHFRIGKLIRFEGPNSHITKMGTPTMGGWMIIVPVVLVTILMNAAIILGLKIFSSIVFVPLAVLVGYGLLGAIDDWEGIRGDRIGKGMSAKTKLFIQVIFAIPVAFLLRDVINVPQMFWPGVYDAFELGGWYIPIAVFMIVASSNAINFTDGLDYCRVRIFWVVFVSQWSEQCSVSSGLMSIRPNFLWVIQAACQSAQRWVSFPS